MKNVKNLARRSLAMLLVLLLCVSTLNMTAFAATQNPERGYYDHIDIRYTGGDGTYTLEHYDASGKVLLWTANGRVTVRNVTSATYVEYGTGTTKTATFTGNATQDGGEFETSKNLKVQSHQWISVNLNYDYSYTVNINGTTATYTGNRTSTVSLNTDNTVCDDRGGYIGADLVVTIKDIEKDIEEDVGDQVQKDYDQIVVNKVWQDADGKVTTAPEGAEITVQLKRNDSAHGSPVTLSKENGWTASWTIEKNEGESFIYSVKEVEIPGYESTVSDNGNNSFTITNKAIREEPKTGSLTITKKVVGLPDTYDKEAFTFTVTSPDGYSKTVTLKDDEYETLKGLTPGVYTVTEDQEAAKIAPYTLTATGTGTYTVEADKETTVTVTNEYELNIGFDPVPLPEVTPTPELTIEKTVSKTTAEVGDLIMYTITVYNKGAGAAENVVISDTLPEGVEYVSYLNGSDREVDGNTVKKNVGTLNPGESASLVIRVRAIAEGKLENTAIVSSDESEDIPSETVETQVGPDTTPAETRTLTIHKVVDGANAPEGDVFTFAVTVNGVQQENRQIKANESFTVAMPLGATFEVQEIDLPVGYTSALNGKISGQLSSSMDYVVTNYYAKPELSITKTASKTENVNVGDTIMYTIKVTNNGEGRATDVFIRDTLPEGLISLPFAQTDLSWKIGVLEAGKSVTKTVTVKVVSLPASGQFANIATVSNSVTPDVESDPAITETVKPEVPATYTLTVHKTVKGEGAPAEDEFAFEVTYGDESETFTLKANETHSISGIPAGTKYTITETEMPEGYKALWLNYKGTLDSDKTVEVINTYTAPRTESKHEFTLIYDANANGEKVGNMPEKETEEDPGFIHDFTLKGTPTREGYEFMGWALEPNGITKVTTARANRLEGDSTVTVYAIWQKIGFMPPVFEPVNVAGLKIEKSASRWDDGQNGYRQGDIITYDIVVTNTGYVRLENVIVTDQLEGLNILPGAYVDNRDGTVTIYGLDAGQSITIKATYTVTADDVALGSVTNTATVYHPDVKNPDETKNKVIVPTEKTPEPPVPQRPSEPDEPTIEIPEEDPPLSDLPDIEIPEEDPPLADLPEIEIPEEDPPLADLPEIEIPEDSVPLGDVPNTGDNSGIWMATGAMSAMGLVVLTLTGKREEEDEEA